MSQEGLNQEFKQNRRSNKLLYKKWLANRRRSQDGWKIKDCDFCDQGKQILDNTKVLLWLLVTESVVSQSVVAWSWAPWPSQEMPWENGFESVDGII